MERPIKDGKGGDQTRDAENPDILKTRPTRGWSEPAVLLRRRARGPPASGGGVLPMASVLSRSRSAPTCDFASRSPLRGAAAGFLALGEY